MQPTIQANPAQQIDQTYGPGGLIEEIIHSYPPDGGGVRRWKDDEGEHTEPVTGLPIPVAPTPDLTEQLTAVKAVLAEAAAVEAPVLPEAVLDILVRAAEAIEGVQA